MTPSRRAELRRLSDAATAAPWRPCNYDDPNVDKGVMDVDGHGAFTFMDNLRLIAAARNALPELLDELDERDNAVAAIQKLIDEAGDTLVPANGYRAYLTGLRAALAAVSGPAAMERTGT